MTKIILTRHGHVEGIKPERFRGRMELELTEQGRKEAELTRDRIKSSWQVSAIYSSPMHRAADTARTIGQPFHLEPVLLETLNDIDYGEWQGLTIREARSKWPLKIALWLKSPHLAEMPGGETLRHLQSRVLQALDQILTEHPRDTVVVVGHDSVNRALLCHMFGLSLSNYWNIKQEPCCINEIDAGEEGFTFDAINDVTHLAVNPSGEP